MVLGCLTAALLFLGLLLPTLLFSWHIGISSGSAVGYLTGWMFLGMLTSVRDSEPKGMTSVNMIGPVREGTKKGAVAAESKAWTR